MEHVSGRDDNSGLNLSEEVDKLPPRDVLELFSAYGYGTNSIGNGFPVNGIVWQRADQSDAQKLVNGEMT